jgi:hypothetical protein
MASLLPFRQRTRVFARTQHCNLAQAMEPEEQIAHASTKTRSDVSPIPSDRSAVRSIESQVNCDKLETVAADLFHVQT